MVTYLAQHDFSPNTRKAVVSDLRKFARWFTESNRESFRLLRVTTRDVTDFRSYIYREKKQAVASVNRALVLIRNFFDWAVQQNAVPTNPAKAVKELRRQQLAPKGLDRADVRRLLREIELRQDIRGSAIFHLLLYTGCRVSDLVNLELGDLTIKVCFKFQSLTIGSFRSSCHPHHALRVSKTGNVFCSGHRFI